ncbi:hypothetical protein [Acinetobacter faecalis]|uniref:Uncharacterized protein n=1 Tax=Acinetobacter faecalis TaxID=2665161 RepID=A0ABU5GKU9_9GAMM|nr:hypothetical protein [Acinetobacter faecalis]MDY6511470.1 hypothetical protein [Acinetobacter faecalis]MDY6551119.1 hypothetical protein [Acinetobacter faecalis]
MNKKREKFVELAEARVEKTLKDIQLIGNLSNKAAYEYSEEDVKKIFAALQQALNLSKSRFNTELEVKEGVFKL